MNTRRIVAAAAAVTLASVATVAGALLVALSSSGVLNRSGWTIDVTALGRPWKVNAAGLVRFATLPATMHVLDGRSIDTAVGRLHFTRAGNRLSVDCSPCTIRHPELAARTATIARMALSAERSGDQVFGEIRIDEVSVQFAATLASDRVDVRWNIAHTPIGSFYSALASVIPEARVAMIGGVVHARGRLSLPSRRSAIDYELAGFEVSGLQTERFAHGRFTHACLQPDGSARPRATGEGAPGWLTVDELGELLASAVIAAEDQRFAQHAGYDELEIARLLAALGSEPTAGASTITQQLARTLVTGGEKSLARKLRELLYAVEMERTLGKARILQLYLNVVDWGPGICGAAQAARTYFDRTPARLTPLQAAWLAGILRQPHRAHAREFAARKPDHSRASAVLMQMRQLPRAERQRWARGELSFAAAVRPRARPPTGSRTVQKASRQSAL